MRRQVSMCNFICAKGIVPYLLAFVLCCLANGQETETRVADKTSAKLTHSKQWRTLHEELRKKWPHNRTIRLVFHGHSVPAGYFRAGRIRRFDSYPMLIYQRLCESFPTAMIDVSITAIGGENSSKGAARFNKSVLSLRPDMVFIDYSLNDRALGLKAAEKAWRQMIRASLRQGVITVLLTPTPDSHEDLLDPTSPLAQHADQVRRLGKEYGLQVVDSYAAFKREVAKGVSVDTLLSQPNHPNRKGHMIVAKLLTKALEREAMPPATDD